MAKTARVEWTESRVVLQNDRKETLIIRPTGAPEELPWEFPGGRLEGRESPEAALRRICNDQLGIELEFVQGQPPFVYNFGTHSVTYRYYFCRVAKGKMRARGAGELRWVRSGQLREYVFDAPTQQVVDWLLEEPG
jgi:mutator protein MutT